MASKAPIRYAVAAFADARHLLPTLRWLVAHPVYGQHVSLLALESVFAQLAIATAMTTLEPGLQSVLGKHRQVTFGPAQPSLGCTEGSLCSQLVRAIHQGCQSFAELLGHWMVPRLAVRLNNDVVQGQLLLWIRLSSSEDEDVVCSTLLNARALRVEVHDLVPASIA